MPYSAISPGNPRIPDVKTVAAFIPTPRKIPAFVKAELIKYMAIVPKIPLRHMFRTFSIISPPDRQYKLQTPVSSYAAQPKIFTDIYFPELEYFTCTGPILLP